MGLSSRRPGANRCVAGQGGTQQRYRPSTTPGPGREHHMTTNQPHDDQAASVTPTPAGGGGRIIGDSLRLVLHDVEKRAHSVFSIPLKVPTPRNLKVRKALGIIKKTSAAIVEERNSVLASGGLNVSRLGAAHAPRAHADDSHSHLAITRTDTSRPLHPARNLIPSLRHHRGNRNRRPPVRPPSPIGPGRRAANRLPRNRSPWRRPNVAGRPPPPPAALTMTG